MKKKRRPPANAVAWCDLHRRMMNGVYIQRKGCVVRKCKHLHWLGTQLEKGK